MKLEAETGVLQPRARNTQSHPKPEEARNDSLLEPLEGMQPCRQLILNFWPPEP